MTSNNGATLTPPLLFSLHPIYNRPTMTALAKSNLRNFALLWALKWCMCVCACVRECAGAWSTVSSYMHKDPRSVQDACIEIDAQKRFAPLCI